VTPACARQHVYDEYRRLEAEWNEFLEHEKAVIKKLSGKASS